MINRLLTRPLEVSTPGEPTEDPDYRTPIPGEPTTVTVLGYIEQTGTSEETVGQQTATGISWGAIKTTDIDGEPVRIGTEIKDTSTVTAPDTGETFQITGRPAGRWNPWRQRVEFIWFPIGSET